MKTIIGSLIDKTALLENFQGSPELTEFRKKLLAWKAGQPTEPLDQEYKILLKEYVKSGDGSRTMLMRAAANAADPTYLALMGDLLAFPELDVDEEISLLAGTPSNALLMAVESGSHQAVQSLICAYAKVDLSLPASFMGVSFGKTPLSIAREKDDEALVAMLENAKNAQVSQLLQDLIDCKTNERYDYLWLKQDSLDIKKTEVVSAFMALCSSATRESIALLNQALERDEYGRPANIFASYLLHPENALSIGKDEETVLKIENHLRALESGHQQKAPGLLVYKYGPQHLTHPLDNEVKPEILHHHHVNSSFF